MKIQHLIKCFNWSAFDWPFCFPPSSLKSFQIIVCFLLLPILSYSQTNLDSLWSVWEDESQIDTNRLSAIQQLIGPDYTYNQPDSALYFITLEHELALKTGKKKWIARAEMRLAFPYYVKSNYNKFIEHNENALALWEEIKDEKQLSRCLVNLGAAYESIGETDQAFEVLSKNLVLQEKLGDKKTIGQTLHNLSQIYRQRNDYSMSIDHLFKALDIWEEIDSPIDAVATCKNIGNTYEVVNEYDKALEFYQRAFQIAEKTDNPYVLAGTYTSLGNFYSVNGIRDFDEAIVWLTKALDIYKSIGDNILIAYLANGLGRTYEEKGEWGKAIYYYQQCLTASENIETARDIGTSWTGMGRIEMYKGNYSKSVNYANQALTDMKDYYEITTDIQAANILYQSHKALGNYEKALLAHEKHRALTDSLKNEKNKKQVLRQEYQYSYDKQALADSLEFAQKEAITNFELEKNQATLSQQRLGLIATILGLLLVAALAYFFYQSKKRQEVEANRIKELDTFKSTFYTNITHEFRTPLTVILGMANQIEEKPDKFLGEGISLIKRNGKNLLNQINQILDLSKLETNTLQLNIVQSDIVEFLRYSTEAFQSFANGQNLSLRFFSPVEKLLMDYDPDIIQNIMSNLVSNAMKFTSDGGDVKVALENTKEQIKIKVQDTGLGISKKDLPHIFDRFYQVKNNTEEQSVGTGVGLAYVQELVRTLGGTISVESELGKGTSFTVALPIRNEAKLIESTFSKKENLNWIPSQTRVDKIGNTKTAIDQSLVSNENLPQLLLIEDNADVVIYLKSCLSDQYQIDVAYNGRFGIEKALENIPDLIISDVMMPDKDGFEVCDTLKNDERTSHIPLILLTAKADAVSKLAGLKRGADAYLSKPFDKEELLVRLEMLVERQKRMVSYFSKNKKGAINENETAEVIEIEDVFIKKINTILEENIGDEDFGLPQLCQKVRMSRSQLFRKMKALTDTAPSAFIKSYRLQKAKYLLENTEMNVAEAAYEVGFKDPSYFSKIFQEEFGQWPSSVS